MDYYSDMKRLAKALLGLGKAIIARPKKATQAPTQIHWTKADKPLEEMTSEERKNFAEKMATESLETFLKNYKNQKPNP